MRRNLKRPPINRYLENMSLKREKSFNLSKPLDDSSEISSENDDTLLNNSTSNKTTTPVSSVEKTKRLGKRSSQSISPGSPSGSSDARKNTSFSPQTNISRNSFTNRSTDEKFSKQNSFKLNQSKDSVDSKSIWTIIIAVVVLLVSMISAMFYKESSPPHKDLNIGKLIEDASTHFPTQNEDIWLNFQNGIEEVMDDLRPAVFILVYHHSHNTVNEIAKEIARIASVVLNANYSYPLELNPKILKTQRFMNDHGELINTYRKSLEEHRSMIVYDLHGIPGKIAQGFHSFCDTITPLVRKAVIIFTMKNDVDQDDNILLETENKLKELWSVDVEDEILMPLITRLTESVLEVV